MRMDGAGAPYNTPRKASGRMRLRSEPRVAASNIDSELVVGSDDTAADNWLHRASPLESRASGCMKRVAKKSAEIQGFECVFDDARTGSIHQQLQ